MKPTLLVLAAGMGSRYGGLKQMDGFGPNGETIIDYSIYDAINAGFGKVVFIIRSHFREQFEAVFGPKLEGKIDVAYVEQELHKIPPGYTTHPDREKPWGTAHAVLMGAEVIDGPFAVINGDDYYGVEAYQTVADFFNAEEDPNTFAVVGYYLKNTLSDHGTVNRGVCHSEDGNLTKIVETLKIKRDPSNDKILYPIEGSDPGQLDESTLVSMNLFGFKPNFFTLTNNYFKTFLTERGQELKSEFFIPLALDTMINNNEAKVKVLECDASWFGVTYKEDKPIVMEKIKNLISNKVYPENLWG